MLKKIYRKLLKILPTDIALYLIYYRGYKKKLNLKNPKTWGEKIQWLKINGNLEELNDFVDKYEVRKYISSTIGKEYLNKLYGVYDSFEEINWDKLPNQFVIKCTNGSGMVLIVKNKNDINLKKIKQTINKWLRSKYYKEKKELQYKNVKNRIIIEKYLENSSGSLNDYKFYCFNGKMKYYGIFYERYINKCIDFYNEKGEKMNGVNCCHIKNSPNVVILDNNMQKMIKLAERLSIPFTEVRVDFYLADNKIIFGELTFTDGAGSDPWYPYSFDIEIAKNIPLKKVLKK